MVQRRPFGLRPKPGLRKSGMGSLRPRMSPFGCRLYAEKRDALPGEIGDCGPRIPGFRRRRRGIHSRKLAENAKWVSAFRIQWDQNGGHGIAGAVVLGDGERGPLPVDQAQAQADVADTHVSLRLLA